MKNIKIEPKEIPLLRKILPLVCLLVPWEFYFYTSNYSSGWGIKFSLLYANFDALYGMLLVDLMKQLTLLSYGGFLPSIRTVAWFTAALLCIAVVLYELFQENIDIKVSMQTSGLVLLACSALTLISSFAVWNSSFRTIPIAPIFFAAGGYVFLHTSKHGNPEETEQRKNKDTQQDIR